MDRGYWKATTHLWSDARLCDCLLRCWPRMANAVDHEPSPPIIDLPGLDQVVMPYKLLQDSPRSWPRVDLKRKAVFGVAIGEIKEDYTPRRML